MCSIDSFRKLGGWNFPSPAYYLLHNAAINANPKRTYAGKRQFKLACNAANEVAKRRYNKLFQKISGQFKVFHIKQLATTTDEDIIPNTRSSDHHTMPLTGGQVTDNSTHKTTKTTRLLQAKQQQQNTVKDAESATEDSATVFEGNLIYFNVRHVEMLEGKRCVVC